jgi:hypothetical protein
MDRNTRRELRKRGAASRKLDLQDLVLDLPPLRSLPVIDDETRKYELEKEIEYDDILAEDMNEYPRIADQNDANENVDDYEKEEKEEEEEEDDDDDEDDENEQEDDLEGDEQKDEQNEEHEDDFNANDNNDLLDEFPNLPPPTTITNSEKKIIEQHRRIVNERLKQREIERQSMKSNLQSIKHTMKKSLIKSKSIKVKYRRIPTNKMKLIYLDVISQMIKDYLHDKQILYKYINSVIEFEKNIKKKGKKKSKKELEKEVRINSRRILNEYYSRIDDYFSSLIDIRLSNSLIKNDLDKINSEKNKLRLKIFNIRQERNLIGLEMNQIRNEFKTVQSKYIREEKLYKDLISLREGDFVKGNNELIKEVNFKLDNLKNGITSKQELLEMLKRANELLKAKIENVS